MQQGYNNQGRRSSSASRYNNNRENEYLYEDDPPASDSPYKQQPHQQYNNNQRYDEYSVQSSSNNSRRSSNRGQRRQNSIILNTKEEEDYEEYQEQLYHDSQSQHSGSGSFQLPPQQQMQPSFASFPMMSQQQQLHHQQEQPHFSSDHRQFNLTPLYNDVEMASIHSKKSSKSKKSKGGNRQQRRNSGSRDTNKTIGFEDEVSVLTYNSGRYSESSQPPSNPQGGSGRGRGGRNSKKKNQVEGYYPVDTKVLDFLETGDNENSDDESSEDGYHYPEDERGGVKNHEEFYNYGDDDEEDDDDTDYDDEEAPLRKGSGSNRLKVRRSPVTPVISRSEQCLNRTVVLVFATMCFIFIRNHTPWWKEHERRAALQKHHHHNILSGTDDDDQAQVVDPMAVYNTNDDDSTHTRDHDPLHQFDKITHNEEKNDKEEEAVEVDPKADNKFFQNTAGDRVSKRPAEKSHNHGFMDEDYSDRPAAEDTYNAAVAISHGEVPPPPNKEFIYEKPQDADAIDLKNTGLSTTEGDLSRYETQPKIETLETMGVETSESAVPPKQDELGVALDNPLPPPPQDEEPTSDAIVEEEEAQQELRSIPLPPPDDTVDMKDTVAGLSTSAGDLSRYETPPNVELLESNVETADNTPVEEDYGGESLVEWGESSDVEIADSSSSPEQSADGSINESYSSGSLSSEESKKVVGEDSVRVDEKVKQMDYDEKQSTPNLQEDTAVQQSTLSEPDGSILNQAPISVDDVKAVYEDGFNRWNHPFDTEKDVPVFWRIPRGASSTVESILSYCYRMVLADSQGTAGGHENDENLSVVQVGTGARFINVDMSNPAGISHAKDLNLGFSNEVNVISTPFLFETAAGIFKDTDKTGKCFTILRHPVDRAVSLYHHYQIDESGNPNTSHYKGMTIDEYAQNVAENNWMVRFLANKRGGALVWEDLEAAKDVFGKKCLVGLVDEIGESISRYEHFFGWDKAIPESSQDRKNKCIQDALDKGDKRQEHPTYEGTAAWETLRKKNEYDEILYEYAKNLFSQQSTIYEKTT